MKQVFEHYEKWEDYKTGMFSLNVSGKDIKVIEAISLLKNADLFYQTCKQLIIAWPIATQVNLTNKGQNRRAWLGAAACMFACKTPEFLTRIAWGLLDKDFQEKANKVADLIIEEYEKNKENAKTLFE